MNTHCWHCGTQLDVLDILNVPNEPLLNFKTGMSINPVANICTDCYTILKLRSERIVTKTMMTHS